MDEGGQSGFRRSWKRINWDLHSATGLRTIAFSLIWALTGIYFTSPHLFRVPVEKISTVTTAAYPAEEMRRIRERPICAAG